MKHKYKVFFLISTLYFLGLIIFQNIAPSSLITPSNSKKKHSDALVKYYKCITKREIEQDPAKDQYKYDFFMSRCSYKHPDVQSLNSEAEKKEKIEELMKFHMSKMQKKLVDFELARNLKNIEYASLQPFLNKKSNNKSDSNSKAKPQRLKDNYILHFKKEKPTNNKFCRIKKQLYHQNNISKTKFEKLIKNKCLTKEDIVFF